MTLTGVMSWCITCVCLNFNCTYWMLLPAFSKEPWEIYRSFLWLIIRGSFWLLSNAVGPLLLLHCLFSLFTSLFTSSFPQQCSNYQTVPTSPCSVYTPLSRCHHSYISCQVELASFSPSCCSTAKNKAPFCGAAMRLQSGPPQGLKLHFLTNRLHFQESEADLVGWCSSADIQTFLKHCVDFINVLLKTRTKVVDSWNKQVAGDESSSKPKKPTYNMFLRA